MNEIIIRYNRKKSLLQIIGGILIWTLMILINSFNILGIPGFFLLIIGGSFIYYGLKSLSGKPQIIISDEGMYIGFKYKKTIPWNRIVKVDLKTKNIDLRGIKHLRIHLKVNTGPAKSTVKEFQLQNLERNASEIEQLIVERLNQSQKKIQF